MSTKFCSLLRDVARHRICLRILQILCINRIVSLFRPCPELTPASSHRLSRLGVFHARRGTRPRGNLPIPRMSTKPLHLVTASRLVSSCLYDVVYQTLSATTAGLVQTSFGPYLCWTNGKHRGMQQNGRAKARLPAFSSPSTQQPCAPSRTINRTITGRGVESRWRLQRQDSCRRGLTPVMLSRCCATALRKRYREYVDLRSVRQFKE